MEKQDSKVLECGICGFSIFTVICMYGIEPSRFDFVCQNCGTRISYKHFMLGELEQ